MMSEDPIAFLSNVLLQCEIVTYYWCFLQQKNDCIEYLNLQPFLPQCVTMCIVVFFSFLEINVFGNKGFGSGEVIHLFNH